ncbi:MAG: hypothetical protein DRJ40_00660 [Thermoprotei archaeon]|nr:MAG: hypothetical protein DRJ40_00660 [Thermoprotei archaeon]
MGIMVTTTRRPTPRIRSFCKELAAALPNAIKVNRGKMNIEAVAIRAYELGLDHVIIVGARKGGNPGHMKFMKVEEDTYYFLPLAIVMGGVKLLREFPEGIKPHKVSSAMIVTEDHQPDFVHIFTEALAEVLDLPSCSVPKLHDLRGSCDSLIYARKARYKYLIILNFLDSRSFKPIGPELRIEKFVYKGLKYEVQKREEVQTQL